MSQPGSPAPSGRATPRWSSAGQPLALVPPVSIAGLPLKRASVSVGPPFAASGPRFGSTEDLSLLSDRPQDAPLSRLYPCSSEIVPTQLGPTVLAAMIVPVSLTVAPAFTSPAFEATVV